MNVYRLQAEILSILAKVDEHGEIPSQELLEAIDRINKSLPDRVNTLYKVLRTAVATSTALRNEATYITQKARRWDSVQEFIKECLKQLLEAIGVKSFETDLCRPTICKGPPVIRTSSSFNPASLIATRWSHFVEVSTFLKAQEVKNAVKEGLPLPDGVQVVEGEPYLRVL